MYSSCLEKDEIHIVKTKVHDGTMNEHKRWFSKFVDLLLRKKIDKSNASDEIEKLLGREDLVSKLEFLKYCVEQLKIVIEKMEEFKIKEEETMVQPASHVAEDFTYDEFDKKWASAMYDMLAIKRCVRGVCLIREPSRDMANIKFQPAHLQFVKKYLKFIEDVEEMLFMKDYVVVEDDLL